MVSGGFSSASRKSLSINTGFSSNSSILCNALLIIMVGSSVMVILLKNSNASLFSWYPDAIAVSTAL